LPIPCAMLLNVTASKAMPPASLAPKPLVFLSAKKMVKARTMITMVSDYITMVSDYKFRRSNLNPTSVRHDGTMVSDYKVRRSDLNPTSVRRR